MSNFAKLVESEKKNMRKQNLAIVREEIEQSWVQTKIQNFVGRWDDTFTVEDIIEQIKTNDLIAAMFCKDPGRQNISEKLCAKYLGWKTLPQSGKNAVRFNTEGEIVATKTMGGGKCADFLVNGYYITQKYTGENTGGAQDNQMDDVITFLLNASKHNKCGACVDGWYWEENGHKELLINMFRDNPNVIIFSADEVKEGKIRFE